MNINRLLDNLNLINKFSCGTNTYSFNYGNAHFVAINEYYDGTCDIGTEGDVVDELYNWLVADLDANTKPAVSGATVTGSFGGEIIETYLTANTNSSGLAVLESQVENQAVCASPSASIMLSMLH